jgi:hypothetical protein
MPFYVKDWLGCPELRRCGRAAMGLWMDMLCEMWMNNPRGTLLHGKPVSDNKPITNDNKRYEGYNKRDNKLITELEREKVFSRFEDGTIYCRRMYREALEERQIGEARSEAGKRGMASRWHNKAITRDDNKPITNITSASASASASASKTLRGDNKTAAPKSGDPAATLPSEKAKDEDQKFKTQFHVEWENWVIRKTKLHPEKRDLPRMHAMLDEFIKRSGLYPVNRLFNAFAGRGTHSLDEFFEAVKKLPDIIQGR